MSDVTAIAGAADLVGRGVYLGLPFDIPAPLRDRHAVVVGDAETCAIAARQLRGAGWRVTVVMREGGGCGIGGERRRRLATDVVCAAGVDYLEAVVLRRVASGHIDACNASALFLL